VTIRTISLTILTMLAFAGNSILCRMALGAGQIDAASFATMRIASGGLVLALLLTMRGRKPAPANWRTVAGLFAYVAFFSFAYLSLTTGTGALILFGAVQLTMFFVALRAGEHFSNVSWAGLVLAFGGLVYLVSPGLTAPDPLGAALMAAAGIAWGAYSLLGRGAKEPLAATASNFIFCIPLVVLVSLAFRDDMHLTTEGILLAVVSGGVTSGIGYSIWYEALKGLTAMQAATVQLSVPAIAAIGGVLLLSESVTMRLVIASLATLGGVWIVLRQRTRST